ncbi:MAG: hypothetical protein JO342_10605 [Solirubrobacterales bacterium]|nr:hypothetical protein [Solirubrobacterales bacterium]
MLPILAVAAGAVALSPAGATIARWVKDTLGVPHAAKALFSLPAPGRLLLSGPGGAWIIGADGSAHRLGAWPQASWSPHGLYIAAVRDDQLAALSPQGATQWTLGRPALADPRWYPPTGYRVAYLSRGELRVVAGDGTGDHALATSVATVAPAWRPGHPYQLAYLTSSERLVVRDASTDQAVWSARPGGTVRELSWSANGARLVAITPVRALVYGANGRVGATIAPRGGILNAALSPDGRQLALLLGGAINHVELINVARTGAPPKPVFSGDGLRQLAWSPNGHWLLITWPAADQWVFSRVVGSPRLDAVSRIAEQFGTRTAAAQAPQRGSARRGFPQLDGWCCTPWSAGG